MDKAARKVIRLKTYDYNSPGYYFVTVCTKNRQKLLCDIVGTVLPDGPQTRLTACGKVVEQQLRIMTEFYEDIRIDKYVVMPNHIHLLVQTLDCGGERPGRVIPTDTKLGRFVGTLKRFTNKKCGRDLWQARSYDHVIRGVQDYREIWKYIEENPWRWAEDRFYVE